MTKDWIKTFMVWCQHMPTVFPQQNGSEHEAGRGRQGKMMPYYFFSNDGH